MSHPVWCNLCNRNVIPKKDFNWLVFIFLCGFFYIPYYILKKEKCPICGGDNFSPARPEEMGRHSPSYSTHSREEAMPDYYLQSHINESPPKRYQSDKNLNLIEEVEIRCRKYEEIYTIRKINKEDYNKYMVKLAEAIKEMKDKNKIDDETFNQLKEIIFSYYKRNVNE